MSLATDVRDAVREVGSSAVAAGARVQARFDLLEARIQELIDAGSADADALQEALDEAKAADVTVDALAPAPAPEPEPEPTPEPTPEEPPTEEAPPA